MAKSVYANRREVLLRSVIGVLGGYALAALAVLLTILLLPAGGRSAEGLGQMIGFSFFGLSVILAFSVRSAKKAWMVVGLPLALLGACYTLLSGGGA
ncbi:DUF3649 domain-containing protein [Altericroceibacterium xinjiangense]|uniref:DUF3649 domain-containing protein n=1 Tax=Altericroceibacterium xinjiangense TaxID=762261 RepID=UPI000F7EC1B1|nr:DUF3649 domain-containing protein [Altericroceibacterium xinjiangense]